MQLKTEDSPRLFKIHKSLLEAKSYVLSTAIDGDFCEGQEKVYTFKNTHITTLARFVEWAYTGTYPEIIEETEDWDSDSETEHQTAETDSKLKDISKAAEKNEILSHVNLYIFAEIYMVPEIQTLAFERATAHLVKLRKPKTEVQKKDVIDVLLAAFSELTSDDTLVDWLARYASWCIEELRTHGAFLSLLIINPIACSKIFLAVRSANSPPW